MYIFIFIYIYIYIYCIYIYTDIYIYIYLCVYMFSIICTHSFDDVHALSSINDPPTTSAGCRYGNPNSVLQTVQRRRGHLIFWHFLGSPYQCRWHGSLWTLDIQICQSHCLAISRSNSRQKGADNRQKDSSCTPLNITRKILAQTV